MEQHSILFISLLLLIFPRGQYTQSPCPQYFEYKNDESGIYGLIHVIPNDRASSVTTAIDFTVGAQLPSKYLGKMEPIGENLQIIQGYKKGVPFDYRVHFPVTSPVPKITSIKINNNVVCSGPGDTTKYGNYVTSVGLQHTIYLNNPSNVYDNNTPKPATVIWDNNQNFPSFDTNNGGNKFIIVENPLDDRFLPTKPIDWNAIFNRPQGQRNPVTSAPPPVTTTTTTTPRPVRPRPTTQQNHNECGLNADSDSLPLIYQGMSYERGDWPWVVAIFRRKDIGLSYICSGTLISNRHVITAAHCMRSKTTSISIVDIVVKAGVYNLQDWGDEITINRILSSAKEHESYDSFSLSNDILLLTFTKPVEFNAYIKAACLWSGNPDIKLIAGNIGVVTGWGVSEIDAAGKGEPRMVRMPVVTTDKCRASRPDFHSLTSNTTLCAGDRKGAGPCLGDSGGGLYLPYKGRWALRGIVSLSLISQGGDRACNLNEYVVFTDTAQYISWITDNMST